MHAGGLPIDSFRITSINQISTVSPLQRVNAPGTVTSFEMTGLAQFTEYLFRIQAVNSLGASIESPGTFYKTGFTLPARVENFTVAPNSEVLISGGLDAPTVSLTLRWSIPLSGDGAQVLRYKIFTYRVGDDYNQGAEILSSDGTYVLTRLPGGVDFTFFIQAINSKSFIGPLSAALEYRTISVVPREIKSFRIVPAQVRGCSDAMTGMRARSVR